VAGRRHVRHTHWFADAGSNGADAGSSGGVERTPGGGTSGRRAAASGGRAVESGEALGLAGGVVGAWAVSVSVSGSWLPADRREERPGDWVVAG
jgi:hypothetical protein